MSKNYIKPQVSVYDVTTENVMIQISGEYEGGTIETKEENADWNIWSEEETEE